MHKWEFFSFIFLHFAILSSSFFYAALKYYYWIRKMQNHIASTLKVYILCHCKRCYVQVTNLKLMWWQIILENFNLFKSHKFFYSDSEFSFRDGFGSRILFLSIWGCQKCLDRKFGEKLRKTRQWQSSDVFETKNVEIRAILIVMSISIIENVKHSIFWREFESSMLDHIIITPKITPLLQ